MAFLGSNCQTRVKYKILICDRYIWDSYVEIKTEFENVNIDKWYIWKLIVFFSPKPIVSFFFSIPSEVSIKRDIQKKELTIDNLNLKIKKISLYYNLAIQRKWTNVISGLLPIEVIHYYVLEVVNRENIANG